MFERRNYEETIQLRTEGMVVESAAVDISEGGVSVRSPELSQGTSLMLFLTMPNGNGGRGIYLAEGTVVWRRGDRVGIEFGTMAAETIFAVADYVNAARAA
jgi:hypothetical protein